MKPDEIRATIIKHRDNHGPYTPEQSIAYWQSSCSQFLCELAAQVADLNENLNIILDPPIMYDTSNFDLSSFLNFLNQ